MFNPSSPVTGQAVTGLTSPTFTLAADTPVSLYERQWYVSALGGTQTGVAAHSADRPFTLRTKRPSVIKTLVAKAMQVSGLTQYISIPVNSYDILVNTKGQVDSSGLTYGPIRMRLTIDCAAGIPSTANGIAQVRAAASLLLGSATNQVDGLVNNVVAGTN